MSDGVRNAKFTFREFIAVVAVSGVTTLNVFLTGAMTVALPTIGKDLKFKQADLQWPVNVYSLSYGCLLLFFGRVGDILGPKLLFLIGTIWFSIWSIPHAFAPNPQSFICFMALKGLGAAANTPAAVSVLSGLFEPGPKRNKAFAFLGAGQPIGFILGLILGGLLTDSRATWRGIFYIQAGLGILFSVLGWVYVDAKRLPLRYNKGLDWGGAVLCTAGVGLLTYSVADSTTAVKGWATPHIPSLLSVSVVLLTAFVYYERWREARDKSVLIPMSIFTKNTSSILFVTFFMWWCFNTLSYFATLYYQQVNLLNPLQTAARFVPMAISGFIVNLISGYALGFISGYWISIIGLGATMATPIILATINVNASYWASAFLIMILIVGADAFYVVGQIQIVSGVAADSQSLAGGLFNVASRIGTSIGLAVTSTVAATISDKYFHKMSPSEQALTAVDSPEVLMVGYRAAGWTCFAAGALAFIGAGISLRGTRKVKPLADRSDDITLQSIQKDDVTEVAAEGDVKTTPGASSPHTLSATPSAV